MVNGAGRRCSGRREAGRGHSVIVNAVAVGGPTIGGIGGPREEVAMIKVRAPEERPVDLGPRAAGTGHSQRAHVSLRWTPGSPLCCGQDAHRDSGEQGKTRESQPVSFSSMADASRPAGSMTSTGDVGLAAQGPAQ